MTTQIFFWLSIFFIFYVYLGYPSVLMFISFFKKRVIKKGDITPLVSFIITAYNEEKRIRDKIQNTLKQDYPREKFEVIIASDSSTDKTEEIVKSYESHGVVLVRAPERRGKENAQKFAVTQASGEILVFSDVATILETDGVTNIVRCFHDQSVGCVSSEDKFIYPDGKVSGEGAYVKYEMFLRKLESEVNSLVGLSGSFFAARKEVCNNWAVDLQSDFNTLLNSVRMGLRGISDPESVGYYKSIANEKKEFDRKVRTVLRGLSAFMRSWYLLNPFKYGLFSWQLFSHKLCRWLVPFAMITAFISNALTISQSGLYVMFFLLQLLFYGIAFVGILTASYNVSIVKFPMFFVLVNLSIMNAWYKYLKGERMVKWQPSER